MNEITNYTITSIRSNAAHITEAISIVETLIISEYKCMYDALFH